MEDKVIKYLKIKDIYADKEVRFNDFLKRISMGKTLFCKISEKNRKC